jgi:hypothetical protein
VGGQHSSPHWDGKDVLGQFVAESLAHVANGSFVSPDLLARYRLLLLIDGHGHAYRSSKLLLSGVPVVKVDSFLQVSG